MRLFLAVEFSEEIRHELTRIQEGLERKHGDSLKFTRSDQLHLTLKFLGEQPETDLLAIQDTIACALVDSNSFSLELDRCGVFPERDPIKIIWAGFKDGSGKLPEQAAKIDLALFLLGIEKEARAFVAHVTLARVKGDLPEDFRNKVAQIKISKLVQPVHSISLVQSVLNQSGPEYNTIQRFELRP